MARIKVGRRATFNAAHRLHNPNWDQQKNSDVFGLCNNPSYHGHNYELHVWVVGEVNQETGYLIDIKTLKDIIREEVIEPFDHRNLNLDTKEFKDLNPTAENIAIVIYDKIKKRLDSKMELSIELHETENNKVIYPA